MPSVKIPENIWKRYQPVRTYENQQKSIVRALHETIPMSQILRSIILIENTKCLRQPRRPQQSQYTSRKSEETNFASGGRACGCQVASPSNGHIYVHIQNKDIHMHCPKRHHRSVCKYTVNETVWCKSWNDPTVSTSILPVGLCFQQARKHRFQHTMLACTTRMFCQKPYPLTSCSVEHAGRPWISSLNT